MISPAGIWVISPVGIPIISPVGTPIIPEAGIPVIPLVILPYHLKYVNRNRHATEDILRMPQRHGY